jgi:hypothetical protein
MLRSEGRPKSASPNTDGVALALHTNIADDDIVTACDALAGGSRISSRSVIAKPENAQQRVRNAQVDCVSCSVSRVGEFCCASGVHSIS